MDTLENIAWSSTFQENQHFINNIPIFKAKDPQSFDDWPEQIDKVAALNKKDPYKFALRDHLVEQLAYFHPLWDGAKLKNGYIIILDQ